MPYVQGFLIEGPVDPGFGRPGGGGPVDPGFGVGVGPDHPWVPGHLPDPPGVWPPLTPSNPIGPIIDNTLPVAPGTIWPPPGAPDRPGNALPGQPARPDNTLPSRVFWMLCYCPSLGWRFVAVDPSLSAGTPLPPAPVPEPKR